MRSPDEMNLKLLPEFLSANQLLQSRQKVLLMKFKILVAHSIHVQVNNIFFSINSSLLFRHILENGSICHNHQLGVFTVMGTTGSKAHAVKLFPKESCTCPATSRCYHIIAARMSISLDDSKSLRRINLRCKSRSKRDKKSGRKAPRSGVFDIIPAPDSLQVFYVIMI